MVEGRRKCLSLYHGRSVVLKVTLRKVTSLNTEHMHIALHVRFLYYYVTSQKWEPLASVTCLQPGVIEGLIDGDPLCRIQHQHASHQVLGTLRDVGPLARIHLDKCTNTRKNRL